MTAAHRASASKAELLPYCAWWARPEAELPPQDPSDWAAFGQGVHKCVELWTIGVTADPFEVARDYAIGGELAFRFAAVVDVIMGWLRDHVSPRDRPKVRGEVPFALDFERGEGRELRKGEHRDYSDVTNSEIPGTADLVIDSPSDDEDTVHVIDVKSGYFSHLVLPAGDSQQLAVLGTAAARAYGRSRARVTMLRVGEGGCVVDDAWLGEMAFTRAEMMLSERLSPESLAAADAHAGPWCVEHRCPAYGFCPATSRSLAQIASEHRLEPGVPLTGKIENVAQARVRLAFLPEVKAACKAYEAELQAWADEHGGIPTEERKTWRAVTTDVERIEIDKDALGVLTSLFGDQAQEVLKVTSSKAAIERLCKKLGDAKERKALVLAELSKCGAVHTSSSTTYKEASLK